MSVKNMGSIKWVALILAIIATGVATAFALNIPGLGKYQTVKAVNGTVTIPAGKVSDGEAHFFKFTDGGKEIGLFIVKGSDGALHTAFDTCDVCYQAKKGYVQQGQFMICKNCNQRFAVDRIGPHAIGGCNPSYLPVTVAGGNVVIKVTDLQAGAKYF